MSLVLMYHRIANVEHDPHGLCVSPVHFAEQLDVLNKKFETVALPELIRSFSIGKFPIADVALTFDDGFIDFQEAYALLKKADVPATLFPVTGDIALPVYIGSEVGIKVPRLPFQDVAKIHAEGLVDIGAHTVTHPFLPEIPEAKQRAEISESKKTLENLVGHSVSSFAYPFGAAYGNTADVVKQCGFQNAFVVWNQSWSVGANPFLLPRLQIKDWNGDEFEERLMRRLCKS